MKKNEEHAFSSGRGGRYGRRDSSVLVPSGIGHSAPLCDLGGSGVAPRSSALFYVAPRVPHPTASFFPLLLALPLVVRRPVSSRSYDRVRRGRAEYVRRCGQACGQWPRWRQRWQQRWWSRDRTWVGSRRVEGRTGTRPCPGPRSERTSAGGGTSLGKRVSGKKPWIP